MYAMVESNKITKRKIQAAKPMLAQKRPKITFILLMDKILHHLGRLKPYKQMG